MLWWWSPQIGWCLSGKAVEQLLLAQDCGRFPVLNVTDGCINGAIGLWSLCKSSCMVQCSASGVALVRIVEECVQSASSHHRRGRIGAKFELCCQIIPLGQILLQGTSDGGRIEWYDMTGDRRVVAWKKPSTSQESRLWHLCMGLLLSCPKTSLSPKTMAKHS